MGLLASLLTGLRVVCATFPDSRKGRSGNIAMADFGLAAFALFFMQSASFLSFQRALEKGQGRSNCQTLFGIAKIPSDNYIRDMLDLADPALLRPCFERVEHLLAQPPLRQAFGRLGGRTLIAWDGTEYFCSQKLGCPHCLTRQRANGRIENYHTLLAATAVAPGHAKVVPLFPDFIAPQDGAEKQDCERDAVKRWHDRSQEPTTMDAGVRNHHVAGPGPIAPSTSITLERVQQSENPRVDQHFFAKVAGAREATLTEINRLVAAAERHIADVQAAPTRN